MKKSILFFLLASFTFWSCAVDSTEDKDGSSNAAESRSDDAAPKEEAANFSIGKDGLKINTNDGKGSGANISIGSGGISIVAAGEDGDAKIQIGEGGVDIQSSEGSVKVNEDGVNIKGEDGSLIVNDKLIEVKGQGHNMDSFEPEGQDVNVSGTGHELKFNGEISKLTIECDACIIWVDAVTNVVVKGKKNKVVYRKGYKVDEPIIMTQPGNEIVQEEW